jgi:DNA-binding MarR family transcriptional regulator
MTEGSKHPLRIPDGLNLSPQVLCHATSLRRATRRVSLFYDSVLAPCGLRSTQRSLLRQVARAQALTLTELAAILVIDRSALAQNLKPLEREGLLSIEVDPADKRSRLVRLTQAGVDKLFESQVLWEQAQEAFEAQFGEEQAHQLRDSLAVVAGMEFPAS